MTPKQDRDQQLASTIEANTTLRELRKGDADTISKLNESLGEWQERARAAEKKRDEAFFDMLDLKQRLLSSERSAEFMRGYLARVVEDDTVREDLVATGDPEAPSLQPKRKPFTETGLSRFPRQEDFSYPRNRDPDIGYAAENRAKKPRHWITY